MKICISFSLNRSINKEFIAASIVLEKVETVRTIGKTDVTQKVFPTVSYKVFGPPKALRGKLPALVFFSISWNT